MLKIGISAPGALLWSLLYLLLTTEEFCSVLSAAAIHEAGHIFVLHMLGGIHALCLTGTGLRLDVRYPMTPLEAFCAAAAGPAAGAVWAVCAQKLGFGLSAQLSTVLTIFNLLPLSPLDGGRMMHAAVQYLCGNNRAAHFCRSVDVFLCITAAAAGLCRAALGRGLGTAFAACWLILFILKNHREEDLV